MAEYKIYTVSVTNGSTTVTTTGSPSVTGNTTFLSDVTPGDLLFISNEVGYWTVQSVTDDDNFELVTPYTGTTNGAATYAVVRDFSPNHSLPLPKKGDIETAKLLERSLLILDSIIGSSLSFKENCRLATTTSISDLTNGPTSIDGVALVTNDRVLIKDGASPDGIDPVSDVYNGIYYVQALTPTTLVRATDADESSEVVSGMFTYVSEGTANGMLQWVLITADPITLDTTELQFSVYGGGEQITAGDGLGRTGNEMYVDVDSTGTASTYGKTAINGSGKLSVVLGTTSVSAAAGDHTHSYTNTLDGLLDTNITSVADGELLVWDTTDWVNQSPATIGLLETSAIGSTVQAYDAFLTSIAALGTAADKLLYTTGVNTAAEATLTSFARTLLDDTDAATARATLGLVIGTDVLAYDATVVYDADIGVNVQAYDAGLQSISGLVTAADKGIYTTALDTYATFDLSSFARTILDDADAATVRTTIDAAQTSHTHVAANITDFTEAAQDAWGAAIAAGSQSGITVTYNDSTNSVDYTVNLVSNLDDLGDVTITSPADNEVLAYDNGSGEWINQTPAEANLSEVGHTHTKSDISDFTEGDYVHTTGVESIAGNKTFSNDVTITGDLTVNGTTTSVNSTEVDIADNIIVLNYDETGTPSQDAGIEIERGTSTNAQLLFVESDDTWKVDPGTGSLTAISLAGHTHTTSDITDLSSYTGFDARYYTETELDAGQLDNRYYTETEVDTLLAAQDELSELGDVVITSPSANEVLTWSGSQWENAGISSGDLDGLTDVTITSLGADELLFTQDGSTWINQTLAEAGISAVGHTHTTSDITDLSSYTGFDARYYTETELDAGQLDNRYYTETEVDTLLAAQDELSELGDVTITSLGADELLFTQDGSTWINQTLAEAGISAVGHTHTTSDITDLSSYTGFDARYYTETELDAGQLDNRYYTESEVDSLLGGVFGDVVKSAYNVASHGFSDGNAIYWNGSAWALAKSDSVSTIGTHIVEVIDTDNFYAVSSGRVTGLTGLTAGAFYFVSAATAGALTTTEPSAGNYSNPIAQAESTTVLMVFQMRANYVGTSGLDDLADVTLTSLGDNEILLSSSGTFINQTFAEAGIQAQDDGLDSIAGLTTAADKGIYTTAADTYATFDLSSFARTILDDADAATVRTTIGAISQVSDDTSPTLGGDLDVGSSAIVSSSNGDIDITPNGTGKTVVTNLEAASPMNNQTGTTYTLVLADAGKNVTLSNASAITLTIPANSSVAFPIGTQILLTQLGAGQVTVAITTDTLNVASTFTLKLAEQYSEAVITKKTSTMWVISGDLELV